MTVRSDKSLGDAAAVGTGAKLGHATATTSRVASRVPPVRGRSTHARTAAPGAPPPTVSQVPRPQVGEGRGRRWWSRSQKVGPWQVEVRHRVDDLGFKIAALPAPVRAPADQQLDLARRAATRPFPRWQWWNGTSIETAWNATHLVQSMLPLLVDASALPGQLVDARRRAIMRLAKADPLRLAVEEPELAERVEGGRATGQDRHTINAALQASLELADDEHRNLRDWRNRLLRVAALATLALGLTLLVAALRPQYLPLCATLQNGVPLCPGGATASAHDAGSVAFLGALGGALAAIIAMRRANPGSSPYRITPALSLVRVPLGGLTAVIGVMLVQSGEIPGLVLTRPAQVAVFALLFGFSQELVTRLLESRARVVQEATKGRSSAADRHDVAAPAS